MSELGTCKLNSQLHRKDEHLRALCRDWKPVAPLPAKQPTALELAGYIAATNALGRFQVTHCHAALKDFIRAYEAEYPKEQA